MNSNHDYRTSCLSLGYYLDRPDSHCVCKGNRFRTHTIDLLLNYSSLIVGPSGRSKDVGRRVLSPAISLFAIIRRDVHDVVYKIAAVGSISVASAEKFIATVAGGDKAIKAYGTYEEVYTDKVCQLLSFVVGDDSGKIAFQDVDAIYIGMSPTSLREG